MQTMDTLDELLTKHPFLSGLNPQFQQYFVDCASLQNVERGQEILHDGNKAGHFYLIHSGKVSLETFVPGCGMVTIQTLGPGEALGWSWLFPPYLWHFTASASEPTELIAFDAPRLRDKAREDREFGSEMLSRVAKILLDRLQGTRMQLIDLYGMRP